MKLRDPSHDVTVLARNRATPPRAFASIGTGSLSHLAMQAIALKANAKMVHVPYASSPQAITAVIRNDVQIACLPAISVFRPGR